MKEIRTNAIGTSNRSMAALRGIADSLVLNQAERLVRRDAAGAAKANQFDQERAADDLRPALLDQPAAGVDGAAGGQQIIDQQHASAGGDAVLVDFQAVAAVLQLVVEG